MLPTDLEPLARFKAVRLFIKPSGRLYIGPQHIIRDRVHTGKFNARIEKKFYNYCDALRRTSIIRSLYCMTSGRIALRAGDKILWTRSYNKQHNNCYNIPAANAKDTTVTYKRQSSSFILLFSDMNIRTLYPYSLICFRREQNLSSYAHPPTLVRGQDWAPQSRQMYDDRNSSIACWRLAAVAKQSFNRKTAVMHH